MHNKHWVIAAPITWQASEALSAFPPILKQILFNRGISTDAEARAFEPALVHVDERNQIVKLGNDSSEPVPGSSQKSGRIVEPQMAG